MALGRKDRDDLVDPLPGQPVKAAAVRVTGVDVAIYDFEPGEVIRVVPGVPGHLLFTCYSRDAHGNHWIDEYTGQTATHVVDKRIIA